MNWFLSDFNIRAWRLIKGYKLEKAPSMTLLYGPPGVGKSSFLNYLNGQRIKEGSLFIDALSFSRQYAYASQDNKLHLFRHRYRTAPLLLIDDLQSLVGKTQSIEELYHTSEYILQNGGKMMATIETDLSNLNFLGERLTSRFLSGVVVPLGQPQEHEIKHFVEEYSQDLRLFMDRSIPELIAQRTENLTTAKRVIHQFIEFAELHNDELSLSCFQFYWSEEMRKQDRDLNPMNIIRETAQTMNLSTEELLGPNQKSSVNKARQIAIYAIRTLCGISYPSIAKIFNRRHSTIVMSYKKTQEKLVQDETLLKQYHEIVARFNDDVRE
jgi:chromosomal replication initiator protein